MRLKGLCSMRSFLLVVFIMSMTLNHASATNDAPDYKWSITVYGGQYINNDLEKFGTYFTKPKFYNVDILNLAVSREIHRFGKYASLEIEGEIGKYTTHRTGYIWHPEPVEFDGALDFRWRYFPWSEYVRTSLAIGDGISYVTERLLFEEYTPEGSRRTLDYVLCELSLGVPQLPHWDVVLRLHHRSGIFGVFPGDNKEGSNFICGGIKYSF